MKSRLAVIFIVLCCAVGYAAEKVAWQKSFREAQVQAKKNARPIFIDVYADWCSWCLKLDQEVYSQPEFVNFMTGFVPVKIDTQDNGEGTKTAERYKVVGLPTLLVTDADGNLLNRIVGFLKTDALVKDLKSVQSLLELEKADSNNLSVLFQLSELYMGKDMYVQAQSRLQRIVSHPSASEVQKERAMYWLASAYYYQNQLDAAQQVLESHYANFSKGASREEILLLLSQVYIEKNFQERAVRYLKELVREFPASESAARARDVLMAIE